MPNAIPPDDFGIEPFEETRQSTDLDRNSSPTSPSFDRRQFLQRVVGVCGIAALGGFAGCARGGDAIGDVDDGTDPPTDTSDLGLRADMEIGLGPTAFVGLAGPTEIDPDEPGGGRLVTVEEVDSGEEVTIAWRRTVERELTPETPQTAGVGEETPTPAVEIVEETGTITATGLDNAHATFLPMYWREGQKSTDTSAIWLSTEAFRELRDTRQTRWSPDVLTRISRLSEEAINQVKEGVSEVDEVYLNAEADFIDFELKIDDQEATVQAIEAHDTFGNAYTILDDDTNPLILKFTYDAVSTGFAGIDAGLWSLIKTVYSGYQVASITVP